ncbi:hypothetical protein LCGC14_2551830, partial [marine sediment metagenome]
MYKLKKKDFYDIYGISLFLHKLENPFIVYDRLMEIANKYIEITDYAIRTELRYLNTGGFDGNDERLVPQDRLYIKNIRKYRKNCSLNKACSHFREHRRWHKEYGGGRWALIVNALQNLIKNFEDKKLNKIVVDINHLNDNPINSIKSSSNHRFKRYFDSIFNTPDKARILNELYYTLINPVKSKFLLKYDLITEGVIDVQKAKRIKSYETAVEMIEIDVPLWKIHDVAEQILKKGGPLMPYSLGHSLGLTVHYSPFLSRKPTD